MEEIVKRIKKDRLAVIIGFIIIATIVLGCFIAADYYEKKSLENRKYVENPIIELYGDSMVVEYDVDGQSYKVIHDIAEFEKKYVNDDLKLVYYEGMPQNIHIDIPEEENLLIKMGVFCVIAIALLTIFVVKLYNQKIQLVKNGELIETEVIKNTPEKMTLRWKNQEDNKNYYYVFHKRRYEKKWIEKIDKIFIMVNKANYKDFYVVGKERI